MDRVKGLIETAGASESSHGLPELAPIANRPLACHVLAAMAQHGIEEVAVVGTTPACDSLRRAIGPAYGETTVSYIERPESATPLETMLEVARFAGGEALLVHPGDALGSAPIDRALREFVAGGIDVTLVAGPAATVSRDGDEPLEGRRMARLMARLDDEREAVTDTGVRILGPRFFELIGAGVPGRRAGELSGVLTALLAEGGRVVLEKADDWWVFDGTLDGLLDGNRRVLDEVEPQVDQASLAGARVQGRAHIHRSAHIEDSTIRGPVVVGAGARIRSAYIGPYTSIGDHVDIRGAEIENSILLPRARIEYIGRRIEASIVGADARISRDFSLPKAVRLRIGDYAEVCLA